MRALYVVLKKSPDVSILWTKLSKFRFALLSGMYEKRSAERFSILVGILEVTTKSAQLIDLKGQIKQLKKKAKLLSSNHNA
ncbi:hypothetical protein Tco_1137402 [Tanacetum coccineum]